MSTGLNETWTVNVRGDAAARIAAINDELKSSRESWGENADAIAEMHAETTKLTDQFKSFGARGNQIASMLEGMPDPIKRMRLAQKLLNKELRHSSTMAGRAESAFAGMRAKLAAIPGAYKAAAGAALAMAAAVGTVLVDAMKKFIAQDRTAKAQLTVAKTAYDKLIISLGKFAFNVIGGSEALETVTRMLNGAEKAIAFLNKGIDGSEDSWFSLGGWIKRIVKGPFVILENAIYRLIDALEFLEITETELEGKKALTEKIMAEQARARQKARGKEALARRDFEASMRRDLDDVRNLELAAMKLHEEERLFILKKGAEDQKKARKGPSAKGGGKAFAFDLIALQKERGEMEAGLDKILDKAIPQDAVVVAGWLGKVKEDFGKLKKMGKKAVEDAKGWGGELKEKLEVSLDVDVDTTAWQTATDQMVAGFVNIGAAAAQMGVEVALGTASLGDLGTAFLGSMGSLFQQVGIGLMLSGEGMKALFTGNPLGAIVIGGALALTGAAMSGFASAGKPSGGTGGAGDTSAIRDIARDFRRPEDDRTAGDRTIIVQIGTREIAREIKDMNRRGMI